MVTRENKMEHAMSSARFQGTDESFVDKVMLGGLRVKERNFEDYEFHEFILWK